MSQAVLVEQQRLEVLQSGDARRQDLDQVVEEDALAVGIHTAVGAVQVLGQCPGDVIGSGSLAAGLYYPAGQLQKGGRLQGHVLHEAHHQRIVTQTQL